MLPLSLISSGSGSFSSKEQEELPYFLNRNTYEQHTRILGGLMQLEALVGLHPEENARTRANKKD